MQHDDEWNGLTRMKSTWDIQLVGAAPMCAHMNALLEPRAAGYRCTSTRCWMEELLVPLIWSRNPRNFSDVRGMGERPACRWQRRLSSLALFTAPVVGYHVEHPGSVASGGRACVSH